MDDAKILENAVKSIRVVRRQFHLLRMIQIVGIPSDVVLKMPQSALSTQSGPSKFLKNIYSF
jgi:hypothetical protein